MSTSEHIFLCTGLPPAESAQRLAEALGARFRQDENGDVFVAYPVADGQIGGEVTRNVYGAPPDPEPDEISVLDGYDTVFEVRGAGAAAGRLPAEAERLYTLVTERLPWPALLLHDLDRLIAAHDSVHGRTDFPAGTTPDAEHRYLWHAYALDEGR